MESTRLGHGLNLGGALDTVPGQPPWLVIHPAYLDLIAQAGVETVRLPVRWPAWAWPDPPYVIDPGFLATVRAIAEQVLARGLNLIITMHFYDELSQRPVAHAERFIRLWQQIAEHFADAPAERAAFELLNEPQGAMPAAAWNELLRLGLEQVRAISPDRPVLAGPVRQNAIAALPGLRLPPDDRLIVAVHQYEPFGFTHQGAPWVPGAQEWLGTTWGTPQDQDAVRRDLEFAAAWAAERGAGLCVSEFGSYEQADPASRVRWTEFVRRELDRLGTDWCYWDFGTDFGVFDLQAGAWREPLRAALLDP